MSWVSHLKKWNATAREDKLPKTKDEAEAEVTALLYELLQDTGKQQQEHQRQQHGGTAGEDEAELKQETQDRGNAISIDGTSSSLESSTPSVFAQSSATHVSTTATTTSAGADGDGFPNLGHLIPRFYVRRKPMSEMRARIKKEARTRFLESTADELMKEKNLEELWAVLLEYQDKALMHSNQRNGITCEERIDYANFKKVADTFNVKAWKRHFLPSVFIKFPRDTHGRIGVRSFFRYVRSKVRLTRLRISLCCFDELGQGCLREYDLENYVFEQVPLMPMLADLEKDFYPYYVFTAVRKFVFFLDPMKKGKIRITDIVHSPLLQEFNRLRNRHVDGMLQGKRKKSDWFSSRSALQVYAMYLNLDLDHNGMLSKQEFTRFNGGSLTTEFVDELFQQYRMYSQNEKGEMEMDYKTFLDFILAMDNRHTPEAIRYFWRILDMEGKGYLTVHNLHYFFRAVVRKMQEMGHETVDAAEVVSNEVVDMINPVDPDRITMDDLIRSNYASTVIAILIDVNAFWKYENRENLGLKDDDDDFFK